MESRRRIITGSSRLVICRQAQNCVPQSCPLSLFFHFSRSLDEFPAVTPSSLSEKRMAASALPSSSRFPRPPRAQHALQTTDRASGGTGEGASSWHPCCRAWPRGKGIVLEAGNVTGFSEVRGPRILRTHGHHLPGLPPLTAERAPQWVLTSPCPCPGLAGPGASPGVRGWGTQSCQLSACGTERVPR